MKRKKSQTDVDDYGTKNKYVTRSRFKLIEKEKNVGLYAKLATPPS